MKKLLCLFLLLSGVPGPFAFAQSSSHHQHEADSLKHLLLTTTLPAEQIRLKYLIGLKTNITRISYWDSLLADSRKNNLPVYECKILGRIGHIHHSRGHIAQTVLFYQQGLRIAEEGNHKAETIELIQKFIGLYAAQYDRKKTLQLIFKGLKIAEEINDKRAIADFYSSLGLYYMTSGEIRKALKTYFHCLNVCKEIGYDFGISSALADIGNAYDRLYEPYKAVPYYLETRKYIHSITEPAYIVQIYTSVSSAFYTLKQYDSAYYYAQKAFQIATAADNKRSIASALAMQGVIKCETGDYAEAEKIILKALEISRSVQFTAELPDLLHVLKRIYFRSGQPGKALEVYEQSVSLRDSLSGEMERKQAIEKEYAYNLEKKEDEYRILAQENEIQVLQLRQNQYLLIGLTCLVLILVTVAWLLIRQSKLRTQHQRTLLEQKLLRAQMNPHFIFNSLNSIRQLVMSGQNQYAEKYLSKFSKLIRGLLESSIAEDLSIKEETEILNMYLDMEALRFGAPFSYAVLVDERIDKDRTTIPPLMIQPFVENAIWHGLLAKENDRKLSVSFEYDTAQTIRCIIDDNGIGREARKQKDHTYEKRSLGIHFIKQRISLISETHKMTGSIRIIDKKDDAGNSLGTTVVIILPITIKPC